MASPLNTFWVSAPFQRCRRHWGALVVTVGHPLAVLYVKPVAPG